jgi:hypothetical protein
VHGNTTTFGAHQCLILALLMYDLTLRKMFLIRVCVETVTLPMTVATIVVVREANGYVHLAHASMMPVSISNRRLLIPALKC